MFCRQTLISILRVGAIATTVPGILLAQNICTRNDTPTLTAGEVAQLAHQYFNPITDTSHFRGSSCLDLVTAVAIAGAETGFAPKCETDNPATKNCPGKSTDYGLWQSNNDGGHCAPAPACGVGSASDDDPSQALADFVCQAQKSKRAFNISNAYRYRNDPSHPNEMARWQKYWKQAQDATQQYMSECICQSVNGSLSGCSPPPGVGVANTLVEDIVAGDPNDKGGSQGVGTQQYITGATPLRYSIVFSNKETASAPAQDVVITDQLDTVNDDLSSVSLGPITFTDQVVSPLTGLTNFASTVDLRPVNNLMVQIHAYLNPTTGLLTWRFTSLDPTTHQPPSDPTAGFLPPGGEGGVFFTVMPKQDLATDTRIQNQAAIVFDVNSPMSTQTWLNTLDNTPPTSHVVALPSWSGADFGSGVQDFTIFVSDNGGSFAPFLTNTSANSATFSGQVGHTYGFYSIARDLVGNLEAAKSAAEATTQVVTDTTPPVTTAAVSPVPNANGWNNSDVTITLTSADSEPGGTGVKQITYAATGAQTVASTIVNGASTSFTINTEGVTTVTFFAVDMAGNIESVHSITIQVDKTPPTIVGSHTPAPNAGGWNNTNVTVNFACADAISGLAQTSPPPPTELSTEGVNEEVTGTCADLAGNSATAIVAGINIDKTPPVLTAALNPSPNVNGWNNTDVTITFAATDALSGVESVSPPVLVLTEGQDQVFTGVATDHAGNAR